MSRSCESRPRGSRKQQTKITFAARARTLNRFKKLSWRTGIRSPSSFSLDISSSLIPHSFPHFLILLYKSLFFTHFPAYMRNMFSLRSSSYDLRGNYILSLGKPKTMVLTYGLNSFSYFSAKQWNALPEFFRTSFFADLKTKIQDVTFT